MAIKFKLITRKNPSKPEQAPKHYASIVRPEKITIDELSRRVAEISPVNELDTQTALLSLAKIIPEYLANGATVELGDLGRLQVNLSSSGVENEEDFRKELIKSCNVRFQPSVQVKKAMKNVDYKKD